MPQSKKFISTHDEQTAQKMIAVGFKLVSHIGSNYTFINHPPKNFNFEQFDMKKCNYTNMLSL